ncbi:GNAT family N-acetyltransferase [Dethiosulfatarculus sandiegensis]|uniref:IAA acetyltransferase n=1 Tax=Dethiosulfatarculus sandiegensis TaxID=1429043 RepID=A0A0D2J8F0_9BACT|nr:GNAT family N-acetyltransferase [Dethiosulfatarculus sandiegensis]KIX11966.1 IAA acetyltransferase [Dethiosulfatarculus sandiegensis]
MKNISIVELPWQEAPVDLLLLADPSLEKLNSYLKESKCVVALDNKKPIGAYVLKPLVQGSYELMSIAVLPEFQKKGVGTALLKHAVSFARESGARRLEVGTGTFGYQLAFYQRQGFRVYKVDRDFFLTNYPEPIYEEGIQLKDMLRLSVDY